MLTMSDIIFQRPRDTEGMAIAFVIDHEVVDTLPVVKWFGDLMLSNPECTSDTQDDKEVVVITSDSESCILETNEKLTAILLSDPIIVQITQKDRAVEPGWAYKDGEFKKPR